jgi:hypothetical protein
MKRSQIHIFFKFNFGSNILLLVFQQERKIIFVKIKKNEKVIYTSKFTQFMHSYGVIIDCYIFSLEGTYH